MTNTNDGLEVKLRRTGGSGPGTQWQWEIRGADGAVLKKGTALGEEHKAFAVAQRIKAKLLAERQG